MDFVKNAVKLKCFRAILHDSDPETYPDPEIFKHDRFLNEDGSVRDNPALSSAFDAGKRICPERHFADSIILGVTSSASSVFNRDQSKRQERK